MPMTPTGLVGERYRLRERLAAGGMGEVWRADDTVLARPVAVKMLRTALADSAEFKERLRREGRHLAALSHPRLARVFDYGDGRGDEPPYLVLELIDGEPLSALLAREGTLAPGRVLDIVAQTADGLSAVHRAGLVHRDVKPGNLLICRDGGVKLTDFGIAQGTEPVRLTSTGAVVGTPLYLSPEQAAGGAVSPATDLYGLGVIAWECLAGRPPFEGHPIAVAIAHRERPLPPLPASVPGPVRALVRALTAKDPAQRPSDAAEVAGWARRLRDDRAVAAAAPGRVVPAGAPAGDGGGSAVRAVPAARRSVLLGVGAMACAALSGATGWMLRNSSVEVPAQARAGGPPAARTPSPRTAVIDPARYYGRPVARVTGLLRALGLRVRVRHQETPDHPAGAVVGMTPVGQVPLGTTVTVFATPASRPSPAGGVTPRDEAPRGEAPAGGRSGGEKAGKPSSGKKRGGEHGRHVR